MTKQMRFIRNVNGKNVWYYVCDGCGSEGELTIPENYHKPFGCPEGCGTTYVQIKSNLKSRLVCVVKPIFAD